MLITDDLARRLEIAEAKDAAACAEAAAHLFPDAGACVTAIAGGVLTFCGETSPLTHALGVGLHGPVSTAELDEIERFFSERGCGVTIDVCPHADQSLLELLTARHYRVSEMNNVLVRRIDAGESFAPQHPVETCTDVQCYAHAVICGFFSRELVTPDEQRIGETLFHMPGASSMVARVDGVAAGGCGYTVRNRMASLFADAVLPDYRRRGVHTAMITARLRAAQEAGCEVATAGTQPGSASQRNYQRLGFEVAYTKLTMVSSPPG